MANQITNTSCSDEQNKAYLTAYIKRMWGLVENSPPWEGALFRSLLTNAVRRLHQYDNEQ